MSDQLVPVPPTAGPGSRPWSAGATRALSIPAPAARVALLQAIRGLGFATTSEQYTVIVAERGSRLRGLSLTRSRMPVSLRADVTPDGSGCLLQLRVEDRWVGTAANRAAVAVYAEIFAEVGAAVDARLAQADPAAAPAFDAWWRRLPEATAAAGAASAGAAARLERTVARRTSRLLDGPRKGPTAAAAAAGVQTVTFVTDGSAAQVPADVVDGMLMAGQLVAGAPGPMPAPLVEQMQNMVIGLEARLAGVAASGVRGDAGVPVAKADMPVITFLYQQAVLRERLPVRLLMTCTTCRLEKIVNPDFVKLRERNRRTKVLQSSLGAAFGTHHISPFILVGRVAALKNSDTDFVCQRCQGTDADEKPVTYCPRCGDRRGESVLRTCPNCKLDLRTLLGDKSVWRAIEAAPEPMLEPRPAPAPEDVAAGPGHAWGPPTSYRAYPAPAVAEVPPAPPVGWHPDPWRRYEVRYFDGREWTVHVGAGGVTMIDPGSA